MPFAAVVHDVVARRPRAMSSGALDTAIVASCAVPFMFRPVLVGGRGVVDGGVSDRDGLLALGPRERVLLHHLPSKRRLRPWRSGPAPTQVPGRPSLVLVTPGLPKVTPFRLDQGPVALQRTWEHASRWLDEPA